jgi:serine/threonine protein kinase
MIGTTVGGYEILESIGLDTWLFKALDPNTDRYVILKLLPDYLAGDQAARERFRLEAKAIAKLQHIHILPIFAYGEQGEYVYSVMRYIDTGTLADRITRVPGPLEDANRLLGQIASVLDYIHANGVVHRDIKPENFVMDDQGNIYLTGFGLAHIEGVASAAEQGITIGTPRYMSPEAFLGDEHALRPTADQYSLGIILYELVTGQVADVGDTIMIEIAKQRLDGIITPPRQRRPDLSEAIERVILRALARAPEDRYPSCGALATAFAQALTEQSRNSIFISYRRSDSAMAAGRLYDLLSDYFGDGHLFMDIDTIEPGEDFVEAIERTLNSCAAMIVMIGKGWAGVTDDAGRRRLDNPNDFVRLEVASALKRNIRVIPALIEEARMPYPDDLPGDLTRLARQNALTLSAKYFRRDASKLIEVLERLLPPRVEA